MESSEEDEVNVDAGHAEAARVHPAGGDGPPVPAEHELPPLPTSAVIPDDPGELLTPPDFSVPIDDDSWLAAHLEQIDAMFSLERKGVTGVALAEAMAGLDHLANRANISLRKQFADARLDSSDPVVARAGLLGMVSALNILHTSLDVDEDDTYIETEDYDMALGVLCWWINCIRPTAKL